MNFCYLSGKGYYFYVIGGPAAGKSLSNRVVLPTSVGDFDMIKSNSSCNNVKVSPELPEEPENLVVLLTAYSDNLVQVKSLTVVV